ncbi:MAG: hypothetical protein KC649_01705, partial [Candidatus Omnitrophica bacterium]|nr:hypothetical protein [Candidatus Omnitrophota bacterium]
MSQIRRRGFSRNKAVSKKEMLVSKEFDHTRVAILENGHFEEFYSEHDEKEQLVGSIFKGKVSSVIPGIGAAFVSLGL